MDRRRFLTAVSGSLAGAAQTALAGSEPKDKVPRIKLGRTKIEVPRIAVGTTRALERNILAYCLSRGANFIDTAPNYANYQSEKVLGQRFRELGLRREQLILASKTKDRDPSQWPKRVAEICERLGVKHLDVLYAHSIGGWGKPLTDSTEWLLRPEVARAVRDLKRRGLIRAFAYSVHVQQRDFVNALIRNSAKGEHIDVLMPRYNFRYYGDDEFAESLAIARKAGQGVIAMKTQSGAKATPDKIKPFLDSDFNQWQAAIRWAASDPNIHAICANMRTLDHARENIEAIRRPRLSARENAQLMHYARATSAAACRMCATCVTACTQGVAIPEIQRALMCHDDYGDVDMGRQTYAEIDRQWRADRCQGCGACNEACPHGLAVGRHVAKARQILESV